MPEIQCDEMWGHCGATDSMTGSGDFSIFAKWWDEFFGLASDGGPADA